MVMVTVLPTSLAEVIALVGPAQIEARPVVQAGGWVPAPHGTRGPPPWVLGPKGGPRAIGFGRWGSPPAIDDSRLVFRLPTSRKVLVPWSKTSAPPVELVEVARLMMLPSLPPTSPPTIR